MTSGAFLMNVGVKTFRKNVDLAFFESPATNGRALRTFGPNPNDVDTIRGQVNDRHLRAAIRFRRRPGALTLSRLYGLQAPGER